MSYLWNMASPLSHHHAPVSLDLRIRKEINDCRHRCNVPKGDIACVMNARLI